MGCTIFEICTRNQLFDVKKINELLVLIDRTLGYFTRKQRGYIISENNNPRIELPKPDEDLLHKVKVIEDLFEEIKEEDEDIYKVIKRMLTIDPEERISLGTAVDLPDLISQNKFDFIV